MKQLCLLIGTAVLGILLVSCSAQKRVWYLQDAQPFTPEQIAENGQIRIKPLDRLTIVVNSKDPCLLYTSPSPRDMRRSRMPSSA